MTNSDDWQPVDDSGAVSDDLIDAYVQGRLPPEQQVDFEAYILDKPELLEQVEYGLLMRKGFKANEAMAKHARPIATARAEPQWRLAAAAAIVSIGIGSMIGFNLSDSSSPLGGGNRLLASQIVDLPITRSDEAREISVALNSDAELVVLRVPLPNPESRFYRVSIEGAAGTIGEPSLTQPDGGGVLNLAVDSARLAAGTYSIEVETSDGGVALGSILLNVTRSP